MNLGRADKASSPQTTAESPVRGFLASLTQLAGYAALLAACGYMSLRSHLNFLGISSLSYLGLERYLMETYTFAADLLLHALTWGAVLALALLPLVLLGFVLWRLPAVRRASSAAGRILRPCLASPIWAMGVLVALLAGCLLLLGSLGGRSDVAVGPLVRALAGRASWRFDATLSGLLLGLLLILIGQRAASPQSRARMAWLWRLNELVLALGALALPLIYGQATHPTRFPLALVQFAEVRRSPECGLVVLATNDQISLWQAHRGLGRVLVLPIGGIDELSMGPLRDLLEEARREARHPSERGSPDCSTVFPPEARTVPTLFPIKVSPGSKK